MSGPVRVTRVVRGVLILSGLGVLVLVVAALNTSQPEAVGSNGIGAGVLAVTVPAGKRACDRSVTVPADATAVQFVFGTYGKRIPVRIALPGAGAGPVRVVGDGIGQAELPSAAADGPGLCLQNGGTTPLLLGGAANVHDKSTEVGGRRVGGRFTVNYLDTHPGTWGDEAGDIVERIGVTKGLAGGGITGPALIVLVLVALAGALSAGWRFLRA